MKQRWYLPSLASVSCCVLFLMADAFGATRTADTNCPSLPTNAGIDWQYVDGPDFSVCYGNDVKTKMQLIGVYSGNFPSFDPKDHKAAESGSVAGVNVQWYFDKEDHPYSRATVFEFHSPHGWTSRPHVWITADDAAQLQRAKTLLEDMRFR